MAGLVPAIHASSSRKKDVEARAFASPKRLPPRRRDEPRRDERSQRRRTSVSIWKRTLLALPAAIVSFVASSAPASADLKICNRMSYVVEAAIGIDEKAATATRGWFRIDPAACRVVVQGTLAADRILLNARALGVYGASPLPQNGTDTLCVASGDFVIAAARECRAGQTPARFTQVTPTQTDDGNLVAYLAEDSEYDDEQARLAAIQRLLLIAGYDAAPIDGVDGPKTQSALAAFLKSRGLSSDVLQSPNFFTTMIDAVQAPSPTGLTWCNDTPYRVMAAVATEDGRSVISRGWYRIDPGKCLHPDVTGQPRQIYSFAEAVDADNRTIKISDRPLNWGGTKQLCTRENKFETNEQGDCGSRGFSATGFAAVDMSSGGKTIRFAMP
ncbi:DUF1036 domain-containing protein [Bradyrhizobium sp. STM 3562]|uniref:DUF1036 domain-containing protein n=1 Tax=Bradyrhizobium sp. STM 3562 TaxID=578924 RepID=UPI0038907586